MRLRRAHQRRSGGDRGAGLFQQARSRNKNVRSNDPAARRSRDRVGQLELAASVRSTLPRHARGLVIETDLCYSSQLSEIRNVDAASAPRSRELLNLASRLQRWYLTIALI